MSTDIDTCNRALQEKENELQRLNTKYNTDIEQLTEQNRNRIQGTVIPLKTEPSNKMSQENLNLIKFKVDDQTVGTEGGRRKTKKHRKKRKSSRKKYTKRRKYSRRPK
jgi:hypothetical protein